MDREEAELGALGAKDSIEMLLKLSIDASGHARHAETTQNQLLTLFLSLLGVFILARNASGALGLDERARWQLLHSLLLVMAFVSVTSLHRGLIAVEERAIADAYRRIFKVWLAKLNPHMADALGGVEEMVNNPSRTRMINLLHMAANGVATSVMMVTATLWLLVSFYIARS